MDDVAHKHNIKANQPIWAEIIESGMTNEHQLAAITCPDCKNNVFVVTYSRPHHSLRGVCVTCKTGVFLIAVARKSSGGPV